MVRRVTSQPPGLGVGRAALPALLCLVAEGRDARPASEVAKRRRVSMAKTVILAVRRGQAGQAGGREVRAGDGIGTAIRSTFLHRGSRPTTDHDA